MTPEPSYAGKSAYRGDVAANYERDRVNETVWQQEQAWMERWAQRVPAGARLLDVPAGTGRFTGFFLARGAHVTAVDISDDMLAELRRRWPANPLLRVERADAEALVYETGSFDFVVCWRLFHLLPEAAAERVLRELARVCRGQIVLEVFGVESGSGLSGKLRAARRWLRKSFGSAKESCPWGHITNYVHQERRLQALFATCGLQLAGVETLTEYRGAPARIYLLERESGARA
ncbi:MAG: methyltransferase domain-containing protein [Verrucomicrobiota bacterium]